MIFEGGAGLRLSLHFRRHPNTNLSMKRTLTPMFTASFLAMSAIATNAATLLTQLNAPNRNNFGGTVGIEFTPTADLSVTSLGYQDFNNDGLNRTHQVGIWNATTNAMITSVTIQAGTASPLDANWRYEPITPVVLTSGQAYYLGGEVFSGDGDTWTDSGGSAGMAISADATADGSRFIPARSDRRPRMTVPSTSSAGGRVICATMSSPNPGALPSQASLPSACCSAAAAANHQALIGGGNPCPSDLRPVRLRRASASARRLSPSSFSAPPASPGPPLSRQTRTLFSPTAPMAPMSWALTFPSTRSERSTRSGSRTTTATA